jgi:hypothetical protein
VEGVDFRGIVLQMMHRGNDLVLEVGLIRRDHTANDVSFQMFPDHFVGIAISEVRRWIKKLRSPIQGFDEVLRLICTMRWSAIDKQEDSAFWPTSSRLRNSIKTLAFTPSFSLYA